jgi:hypothetical protein
VTVPNGVRSSVLRQAKVSIMSSALCNDSQHYPGMIDVTTMFCAGNDQGGVDSCQVCALHTRALYVVRATVVVLLCAPAMPASVDTN